MNTPKAVTLLEGVPLKVIVKELKDSLTPRQIARIKRELEREIEEEERLSKKKR